MARVCAASLARCSSLLMTRLSAPCLRPVRRWNEHANRQFCSQSSKRSPPNVSALYKALTKPFPSEAPDPKLTSLLQSAQASNDPHTAVKALTSNLTTSPIHPSHVSTVVQLCLPAKPQLAESLLSTLSSSVPRHTLIPARAFLARYYTSRNEPQMALTAMEFPMNILSKPPLRLQRHGHFADLGTNSSAWGVIMKSLMQLNYASHACAIADLGLRSGVPVTDGLLHLYIDALRRDDRWEKANSLFERATAAGLRPSERTVGSLIVALTCRSARAQVGRRRVIEVVDMIQSPSVRFLKVALMGLTSVGAFLRAERVFVELLSEGIVEEHMFSKMIAGLGNFVELLPADEVDTITESSYAGISKRSDELWGEYVQRFPQGREASSVLAKLLRVKTRCFWYRDGVDVLERLVEEGRGGIIGMEHVSMLLGAVELACDVRELKRLLKLIYELGLKHNMRSLAFCLGALIGDGDLAEAVAMVRREGKEVIESGDSFKAHHPILLLRRMRTLAAALQDGGVGNVSDVDEIVEVLARHVGEAKQGGMCAKSTFDRKTES